MPAGKWVNVKELCPNVPSFTKPPVARVPLKSWDQVAECPAEPPCPGLQVGHLLDQPSTAYANGARVRRLWGLIRVKSGCDAEACSKQELVERWFFAVKVPVQNLANDAVLSAPLDAAGKEHPLYKPPPQHAPEEADDSKWR